MKKDFLSIADFTPQEIGAVLLLAQKLKKELKETGENPPLLDKKTLVMIFEKPSLRTRLSFESAMTQLGGHAVYLTQADIGMGKRESVTDVAAIVSSMGDAIMARTYAHSTVGILADYSTKPVINGLSDLEHPCQALADLLTIWEEKKSFVGLKVAYVGDGENNVTHSLCLGIALMGGDFICATPFGYEMKHDVFLAAEEIGHTTNGHIQEVTDPFEAVYGADVVYTDTWVSMGDESEKTKRLEAFSSYQVTKKLMQQAKQNAIFMHDLPAYRGKEVAEEVIDGPASVVFDQAENRLHAQKALLLKLLHVV